MSQIWKACISIMLYLAGSAKMKLTPRHPPHGSAASGSIPHTEDRFRIMDLSGAFTFG
jgi:hypothetical protein